MRGDTRHAAVIDGALPEQAGGALGMFADDAGERAGGTGRGVVGGPENGDGGHADGGGDVHRARVVGEEEAADGGEGDEFAKGGLAGEVDGSRDPGGDRIADLPFGW